MINLVLTILLILISSTPAMAKIKDAPKKVCFSLNLASQNKIELFNRLTSMYNLENLSIEMPNYHLGLGCVFLEDHHEQFFPLKKFIGEKIRAYIKKQRVLFVAGHIGRYFVKPTGYYTCNSLVIYPEETFHFVALNDLVNQSLNEWNERNATHFYINSECTQMSFNPHMTIMGEEYVVAMSDERVNNHIIEMTSMLKNTAFTFPVPSYKYK